MSTLRVASINNPSAPSGGLAISTAGNVTGAGMDLIVSQSFSAASAVNVNGCFTATYCNYRVIVNLSSTSATAQLNMRMRVSAADDSSANYHYQRMYADAATVASARTTAQTSGRIAQVILSETLSIDMGIYAPAIARPTQWIAQQVQQIATPVYEVNVGMHNVSTAYDGFSLIPASGNITGTLKIYGLRN